MDITSIFLLKNLATPPRAVALRPCEASLLTLFLGSSFFGETEFCPQEETKLLNTLSRAIISYLYSSIYLSLEDSTLGIRLGHFRYGYSLLGALVREIPNGSNTREMSRSDFSAPLRERKFPLPGSGYTRPRSMSQDYL